MKAIILAAGQGIRLGGKELPKPLTVLADGQSILTHQIEALTRHIPKQDIMMVVGYHKELIMEAFSDLLFVYNPRFAVENTSKSLLRAIEKVQDDLLWINGDVLFHPTVLEKLLASRRSCMAVTVSPVGEEEVKYKTDSQGRIIKVSKTVQEAQGEAVGINLFKACHLPLLKTHLESCADNDYYEKGIEKCIAEGIEVWSCPIDSSLCCEIDFPSDLIRANTLLSSWKRT